MHEKLLFGYQELSKVLGEFLAFKEAANKGNSKRKKEKITLCFC
ncbi:hypothetical protein QFZ78_005671 [Paenibacillus sp. V4I5]|nr:hypothetical protein [Paenibacillus sp. V4I5]